MVGHPLPATQRPKIRQRLAANDTIYANLKTIFQNAAGKHVNFAV